MISLNCAIFYDAPGALATDENGDYIQDADGNYEVVSGTRFKEELSEINVAFGGMVVQ